MTHNTLGYATNEKACDCAATVGRNDDDRRRNFFSRFEDLVSGRSGPHDYPGFWFDFVSPSFQFYQCVFLQVRLDANDVEQQIASPEVGIDNMDQDKLGPEVFRELRSEIDCCTRAFREVDRHENFPELKFLGSFHKHFPPGAGVYCGFPLC
jgi:hypothetical protein